MVATRTISQVCGDRRSEATPAACKVGDLVRRRGDSMPQGLDTVHGQKRRAIHREDIEAIGIAFARELTGIF